MKTYRVALVLGLVATLLLPAVATMAQQGERRISIDFRDTSLKDVLQSLKAAGGPADVKVPEKAGDRLVTVSIVDKTLPQALALVCNAAGLTLANENGVYTATDKPAPTTPQPAASKSEQVPSELIRTPPTASRPEPSDLEAGRGIAPAASTTTGGTAKKDKIYRMIIPNYANLMMLADMFGGSYVSEDNYRNSVNGGGYGNNGNNGYGNNSGIGGNNGSSRGGFRGSASSSRNIGGNRTTGNYGY